MLSLAHGVPMVCAGTGEGKNDVNAHVEYHRAGINLRTEDPTAAAIQAAVERVTNRATVARPSAGVRRRDARPGRCAAGRGSRHRTRAGLLTSAGAPDALVPSQTIAFRRHITQRTAAQSLPHQHGLMGGRRLPPSGLPAIMRNPVGRAIAA